MTSTVWILTVTLLLGTADWTIDNIPSESECVAIAESFITANQINPYLVAYRCEQPPSIHCGEGFEPEQPGQVLRD
jgi:hypothetical protein